MNQEVMKAFFLGLAKLTTAFFEEAAKHGFSIIMLTLVACGLLLRSINVEAACERKLEAFEARADRDNARLAESLREASKSLYSCDSSRQELAIKVAELSAQVNSIRKR